MTGEKPLILWGAYFSLAIRAPAAEFVLPSNVFVVRDEELVKGGYSHILEEAREIFRAICPDVQNLSLYSRFSPLADSSAVSVLAQSSGPGRVLY